MSRFVVLAGALCGPVLSCRFSGAGCGLRATAFAVFASAACGSDVGRSAPAVAVWTAGFEFGAAASAGWELRDPAAALPSSFDPNRLLKKLPITPELAGAADAICIDERGPGAGLDSMEARVIVSLVVVSAGGWTWGGIVPEAVWIVTPKPLCDMAARKDRFMPPSPPVVIGAVGVPW